MQVQQDNAAQADRLVMDILLTHGPTTMDTLVRALVSLSWAQVFSAVDRLSRADRVSMRQTLGRDYIIRVRTSFSPQHQTSRLIVVTNMTTSSQ